MPLDIHLRDGISAPGLIHTLFNAANHLYADSPSTAQDKADDVKIALHSPALLGKYTPPVCTATAMGFSALLSYVGILNSTGVFLFLQLGG